MAEWKETAMNLKKKLDKLHKLYTEEKQYRGKLTGTIYSLQDQLEENKVQSEQRHVELNSEYQQQIQQTKAVEARSQSLEQEVVALRQDRDVKSKVIEKLQQQLAVFGLAQKKNLESSTSNNCDHAHGQSQRAQSLQILRPNLATAPNESSSQRFHQEHEAHNKSRSNDLRRTPSTDGISSTKNREDNDSTRPFQCTQCDSTFKVKGTLKHHIRSVHEKVLNYRCSHCSKGFYSKSSLTRHLRVHTGEKPFQCTICRKACKRNSDLKDHMLVHSDEKPFQCTQCDSSFKRKKTLTTHLLTHLARFECEICGKGFHSQMKCRRHVRSHSDDRLFQCTECDSTFTVKGTLKRHIRSVHEKVLNYRCSHCSKGFYRKSSLINHLRVHTGEKPSQCKVCSKAYKCRISLTKHERNVHGAQKSSDENDKIQSDESEIL